MIQDFIREIHHIGDDTPEKGAPLNAHEALRKNGIAFAGTSDAGKGYTMIRPNPRHAHLLACFGGKGHVYINNQWADCTEGHAYLSPPRAPMAFKTIPGNRWKFVWIYFEPQLIELTGALAEDRCTLASANPYPLVNAVEGLYYEATGSRESAVIQQWADLINTCAQRIIAPQHHSDPLWKLWAQVDASPAADWDLARLSSLAGMSDEALRRLALRYTGRSPMQHVTYLRMRRADALLQSTSAKLAVIAKLVGYDNVYAFSTAFTRCIGVPPSTSRKRHLDLHTINAAPPGE